MNLINNKPLYQDPEWLRIEFCEKRRLAQDIGKECGVTSRPIFKWAKKYGLKRKRKCENIYTTKNIHKCKDKEWLKTQYIDLHRDVDDIAKECNIPANTVGYWTKKFELKREAKYTYELDHFFFHEINSERKAYWLGFLAADGCVMEINSSLNVELAIKDKEHLETLKKDLVYEGIVSTKIRKQFDKEYGYARMTVWSKQLISDLIKHGVVPRKTKILEPPNLAPDMVPHWIRGMFDGDGTISYQGTSSRGHFDSTQKVIEFICYHIPANCSPHKRKGCDLWECGFGGKHSSQRMHDYLYSGATVFLERKKVRFLGPSNT